MRQGDLADQLIIAHTTDTLPAVHKEYLYNVFFSILDKRRFIPRHHRIVKEPHPHFQGLDIPKLWLFDRTSAPDEPEVYKPLEDFCLSHSADSITTLLKPVRALGLFYDFEIAFGDRFDETHGGTRAEFAGSFNDLFVNALVRGTRKLVPDGDDDPLGWRPGSSRQVLAGLTSGLDSFFEYLNEEGREGQAKAAVSWRTNFSSSFLSGTIERARASGYSILEHLRNSRRKEAGARTRPSTGHGISRKKTNAPLVGKIGKRFPFKLLCPMLDVGFSDLRAREGVNRVVDPTGQMAAAIALGGIRGSESLQMWVNDLQIHPTGIFGFLRHPQLFREDCGRTREDILDEYGLQPRNLISGRFGVGFKHPALNDKHWALIKWMPIPGLKRYLSALLIRYLTEVRGPAMEKRRRLGHPDHPYLLVTTRHTPRQGIIVGDPYTTAGLRDSWRRAIFRLQRAFPGDEIIYGKRFGTTRHAVRHSFGKAFDELGATPLQIQIYMHHLSIFSSLVYRQPTDEEAHSQFQEGAIRMKAKATSHDNADTFEELFNGVHDDYIKGWQRYA